MPEPLRIWTGLPTVVDASAVFKLFDTHESGAAAMAELLAEHSAGRGALVAPEHMLIEVAHVLALRRASDELVASIDVLLGFDILTVPLERELLHETARIAAERRISLYDAAYIALAELIGAVLVTADRAQARAAACPVRVVG